jgi:tRNA pseudouridine38-40 synthase
VILEAEEVPLDFHSIKFAKKKIYRYYIYNSSIPDAFSFRYAKYIPYFLNVSSMKIALKYLLGTHDFSAFRSSQCTAKSATRSIYRVDISQNFSDKSKKNIIKTSFTPCQIIIEIEGNGFLKNMVRNIVGTLIEVGKGRLAPEDVKKILNSKDRRKAGPKAPPQGLFLVKVFY